MSGRTGKGLADPARETGVVRCPQCGSLNLARILYGEPPSDAKLDAEIQAGEVVLGGCVVDVDDPDYRCRQCGTAFGSATIGSAVEEPIRVSLATRLLPAEPRPGSSHPTSSSAPVGVSTTSLSGPTCTASAITRTVRRRSSTISRRGNWLDPRARPTRRPSKSGGSYAIGTLPDTCSMSAASRLPCSSATTCRPGVRGGRPAAAGCEPRWRRSSIRLSVTPAPRPCSIFPTRPTRRRRGRARGPRSNGSCPG